MIDWKEVEKNDPKLLSKMTILMFGCFIVLGLGGTWYVERGRKTVPSFPAERCMDHSPVIEVSKGYAVSTCHRVENDMLTTHVAYSINGRWTINPEPAFQVHASDACPSYD